MPHPGTHRFLVHEDVRDLMRAHLWVLMPDEDVLHKILELFNWNHENGPCNRRKFTDASILLNVIYSHILILLQVIPEQAEYEYRVLCVKKRTTPAFTVNGKRYSHPFRQLPRVRCSVHPCFLVPSTIRFYVETYVLTGTGGKLEETERLSQTLNLVLARSIYMSWFDGTKTTRDFPDRPIPFGKRDPPAPEGLTGVQTGTLPVQKEVVPSETTNKVARKARPTARKMAAAPKQPRTTSKRKRKLSDSTNTSSEGESAPPAKRRSPRFTS